MEEQKKENRLTLEQFQEALKILSEMRAVDKERGNRRVLLPIQRQMQRRLFVRWLSVSAAVIVLAFSVGTFLFPQPSEPVSVARKVPILPGRVTAKLILAEGSEVILDTLSRQLESVDGKMIFQKKEAGITYSSDSVSVTKDNPVIYDVLETPRGGEYHLVLADGTGVWLNASSRLRFPRFFSGEERRVYLEGEAYFEVKRDEAHPFIVETATQSVRVLGTSFNVDAYSKERPVTTLASGRVAVQQGDVRKELTPGQQAYFDAKRNAFHVQRVNVEQVIAWRQGMFVFDELPLEQIMEKLARWYNIDVYFLNESAKRLIFKGNLPRCEKFQTILDMLMKTSNVKFKIENRVVIVNL